MVDVMTETASDTVDILAPHSAARSRERRDRLGSVAIGLLLAGGGIFSSRGLTRAVLSTAGSLLIARGATGLSVGRIVTAVSGWFLTRSDLERRFHDGEHDIVDAASFDSFPASDPPSYSPGAS